MRTVWRIGIFLAVTLGVAACSPASRLDRETGRLLTELDGYLGARDVHTARKKDQMDALCKLARSTADPLRRYELEMNIAAEFFAFSFDSTQVYLKHCQELARNVLKDPDLYNEASVQLGHLYAKAGSYLEASQLLYGGLDTTAFSESLMAEYIWALYDYSKDLAGNSGMVEQLSIPPDSSFRPRLYGLLPKDSGRWRSVLRDEYMEKGRLASADSVSRLLLSTVKPEDRDYAIYAFFQSEIENLKGNPTARMAWLIRSAECDIVNAAKDHSLKGVTRNSHYFNVAHCSKVLAPGAVRMGTEGYKADGVTYQWYRNPDGSYAVIALNEGSGEARINFVTDKYSVPCKLPGRSLVSLTWKE